MWIVEALLLAVGLSMDAFAVSICKGLGMKQARLKHSCICGAWFGGFQALMPLIGFWVGSLFANEIRTIDHWVAFGLLVFIGANMLREAFEKEECCGCQEADFSFKTMLIMAIATRIDALAVGISLAMTGKSDVTVYITIGMIGIVTFLLSGIGVKVGNIFGSRYEKKAQATGGIILILLGIKILLEHLLTDFGVIG